jgi:acetolactate synthase-1/2/3 large subunit
MKLSDYVVDFLYRKGTRHIFGMSGGAAVHLFDSAKRHEKLTPIFMAHEQSAAMAADAYYRVSGDVGACVVTSGPGATNLLTGVCCSFYDSVPTMMITGQVATHRLKGKRNVRQVGFQETDTQSIFSTVTKSVTQLIAPEDIARVLESSYKIATSERQGPVLVDIPDDLQRVNVELINEEISNQQVPVTIPNEQLVREIKSVFEKLSKAERPLIILGGGLNTPRKADELKIFLKLAAVPIVQTWAGLDLIPYDWPNRVGTFGVYGSRLGNFAVQNADLIICLGSRLSQNLTGGSLPNFANSARIVMVDVDRGELNKFDGYGIWIKDRICCSMQDFLEIAIQEVGNYDFKNIEPWIDKIDHWRGQLPSDRLPSPPNDVGYVDANDFVEMLSQVMSEDELIFVDTGGNLTWTCNGLRVKERQRVISAWNFTPMGYALPAAIGGCFAASGQSITCIIGDGGLQLCLGELATVVRHKLPIKIILFNNHSHGIQKQTLETWLNGNYAGVDPTSGLGLSDFSLVPRAMGLDARFISKTDEILSVLQGAYETSGPVFINVEINPNQKLFPFVKSGDPLDIQTPLLINKIV